MILIDSGSFDFCNAKNYIFHSSSGFKLAVVYNLDMPVMSQSGIPISPGNDVQIAVRPSITNISIDARERFKPNHRKCYMPDETDLSFLPYENNQTKNDYRYQVS